MQEFVDFLGKHPPFDQLDAADLRRLSRHVEVAFYPAKAPIVSPGTGAVDHLDFQWSEYQPLYRTAAGTGTGAAFCVWS